MSNPTPSYNPLPQQLPNCNIKGSMRIFGNYELYEKYYDTIYQTILEMVVWVGHMKRYMIQH